MLFEVLIFLASLFTILCAVALLSLDKDEGLMIDSMGKDFIAYVEYWLLHDVVSVS